MMRALRSLVRWLEAIWAFFCGGASLRRGAALAAHAEQTLRAAGDHRLAAPLARLQPSLLDPRLRIAVFGEFNRGKSTLLNALLGCDILPAKLIPTTGQIIHLVEGRNEEVRVCFRDGTVLPAPLQDLDRMASLESNGRARQDIAAVEVVVTTEMLRGGLVLLDTPGCNEDESQTARAWRAVLEADLVLFILDAQKLLSAAERHAVRWLIDKLGKPVVVIVNFMNRLHEADRPQARQRLEQWCRDGVPEVLGQPWFEVNALGALKYALDGASPPEDDFWALQHALLQLQGRKRRQLQKRSRRGWLRSVLKERQDAHAPIIRSLQQQAKQSKRQRDLLVQTLRRSRRHREADVRTQRPRLLAWAERTLEQGRQELLKRFAGKARAVLEQETGSWYEDALLQAIATLEREVNATLAALAMEDDCPLEAVALAKEVDTDFQVKPLPSFSRDVLGDALGDRVESWMGVGPDYAAIYGEQAGQKWAEAARCALSGLRYCYDDTCRMLLEHLDRRIRACRREDPHQAALLRRHEEVQAVLKRAVEQLAGRCQEPGTWTYRRAIGTPCR